MLVSLVAPAVLAATLVAPAASEPISRTARTVHEDGGYPDSIEIGEPVPCDAEGTPLPCDGPGCGGAVKARAAEPTQHLEIHSPPTEGDQKPSADADGARDSAGPDPECVSAPPGSTAAPCPPQTPSELESDTFEPTPIERGDASGGQADTGVPATDGDQPDAEPGPGDDAGVDTGETEAATDADRPEAEAEVEPEIEPEAEPDDDTENDTEDEDAATLTDESPWAERLMWGLGILAALVLAALAFVLARRRRRRRVPATQPEPVEAQPPPSAPITVPDLTAVDDPETRLRKLLEQALLLVGWTPDGRRASETAREVLGSLAVSDPRIVSLRDIVGLAEQARFGGVPPTSAIADRAAHALEAMRQHGGSA